MTSSQYAFRAQKLSGIAEGPSWEPSSQIPTDSSAVRCYAHSNDGEWFAYATVSGVQLLPFSSSSTSPTRLISQPNVIALSFSPLSMTLFTFERPVKSNTEVYKNVKAWDVQSGEEVGGWYQKTHDDWEPIIPPDESLLLRPTASDILIFSPPLATRPATRLKVDGTIKGLFLSRPSAPSSSSSSKSLPAHPEPALAVWVGERKGAPASLALYPLSSFLSKGEEPEKTENRDMPMTTARKAFYQADKLSVKWNAAGTMALFLTHMDVDSTGKSYYGETNLYLVSLDGSFDGLVDLDKEGPIYDFCWSPTSREFVVCYGYMPARTQLFDHKAKPTHSLGSQHRNFLLYQPQGRLLLSAGFGNLAGGVDIWDVVTQDKVAEFKASNSSHCEWSPCGRYILTATLSPRLRVDNGVKVWWCGGHLLHIHPQDELYQVSFRPHKLDSIESFPAVLPPAPDPNESVALYRAKGETSNGVESQPAGAYRPPGARGTIAADAYSRNTEGAPSSGATTPTPTFRGGKPAQRYVPGQVPGAPQPGAREDKKKKVRSKRPVKEKEAEVNGNGHAPVDGMAGLDVAGEDEGSQKKLRTMMKKLKAIEDLKEKLAKGETLEQTQLKKIATEGQVKAEIEGLGGAK